MAFAQGEDLHPLHTLEAGKAPHALGSHGIPNLCLEGIPSHISAIISEDIDVAPIRSQVEIRHFS